MRGVGRVGAQGAVGGMKGAARSGAAGFSVPAGGTAASAGAAAAAAVAPLGLGLLALQEGGEERRRNAAAEQRAAALLEELAGLQLDLLDGTADPARLDRLAALEAGEEGADPALQALVQQVALRARVELARRGSSHSVSMA